MSENIPAFPVRPNDHEAVSCHQGMTLRDYFAAKVVGNLVTSDSFGKAIAASKSGIPLEQVASLTAYRVADAMLAARNHPTQ